MRRTHLVICFVALAVLAAACGSDGESGVAADAADAPAEDSIEDDAGPEAEPTAEPEPEPEVETEGGSGLYASLTRGGWEQIEPGGPCGCADGSDFSFWERRADPTKVVFFLQGGGACFSAESCSFTDGTYSVTSDIDDDPTGRDGMFDFDNPDNPLADHSFVFVPYCTGDIHLGTATTDYGAGFEVQHIGYVNGTKSLEYLADRYPDATKVFVTGSSAGGAGAPLYGGLASDLYPDADITVLADAAGAYRDDPTVNSVIGALWGTGDAIPDWPVNEGLTVAEWSIPGLHRQAGLNDPSITLARFDNAFDSVQTAFSEASGGDGTDLVTSIDENEVEIEASGVELFSYVAPGTAHTILSQTEFYTEEVEGVGFVDWFTDLVEGNPVEDVHCEECES